MSKNKHNERTIVGQTAELVAAAYFSERGCIINWPRSLKNPGYDFIAEKDGHLAKVQVKGGSKFTNGSTPYVGCGRVNPNLCDVVFVYHVITKQGRLYPSRRCPKKDSFPRVSSSMFDI
jgi:hypothetical protein